MELDEKNIKPARAWLALGVAALGVAGIFSLILVIARTPQLKELALFQRLFHEALVVHVDLSVLVWFLCIACMLWRVNVITTATPPLLRFPYLDKAAFWSMALGAALMALSPLDPRAEALMSNYIPVISSPVFFLGLALILCGALLAVAEFLLAAMKPRSPEEFGLFTAVLITLMALAAFVWSYQLIPPVITRTQYYEMLFWGGGHVLQFTHTQILMVCWLLLFRGVFGGNALCGHSMYVYFAIGLGAALLTPLPYILYDVTSMEFREFFTHKMIALGGVAPAIVAVYLALKLVKSGRPPRQSRALYSCLLASIFMFAYGGVLGMMIQGQNVVIPAHYHGSIVGVTLAFMGAAYLFAPRFGWRDVSGWRTAFWQPIIYTLGQVMHISGLAWSGGYGVLRKTPGAVETLAPSVKIAMGLMGGGGLIAIIGGLMFVIVMARSMSAQRA